MTKRLSVDINGWLPLHLAILKKDMSAIDTLISDGADVNQRSNNSSNISPLQLATKLGCEGGVRLLLQNNADIKVLTKENWGLLHLAAQQGNKEITKNLLKSGCNIDLVNLKLNSPLHIAAAKGKWEILQMLIDYGGNKDCEGLFKFTPLQIAYQEDQLQTVKLLISLGAKITFSINLNINSGKPLSSFIIKFAEICDKLLLAQTETDIWDHQKIFQTLEQLEDGDKSIFSQRLFKLALNFAHFQTPINNLLICYNTLTNNLSLINQVFHVDLFFLKNKFSEFSNNSDVFISLFNLCIFQHEDIIFTKANISKLPLDIIEKSLINYHTIGVSNPLLNSEYDHLKLAGEVNLTEDEQ